MKINWKLLSLCIGATLFVGIVASIFTSGNMDIYEEIKVPPLAPPTTVFPIVWTILYVLMGVSLYIVLREEKFNEAAINIYITQLSLNFIWTIVFFNLQNFLLSFILIVALWISVFLMMTSYYKTKKIAGILQIPYLLWVTFATYLNFAIFLFN